MAEFTKEEMQSIMQRLKRSFDATDTDKSGSIDVKEFQVALFRFNDFPQCKPKMDLAEIKKVSEVFVRDADKNGDGKVTFEEYSSYMIQSLKEQKRQGNLNNPVTQPSSKSPTSKMNELTPQEIQEIRTALKKAFDEVDKDKSGYIDAKEFEKLIAKNNELPQMKKKLTPAEMKRVSEVFIQIADKDGDGKVNFEEYAVFMLKAISEEKPQAKPVAQSSDNCACCLQ